VTSLWGHPEVVRVGERGAAILRERAREASTEEARAVGRRLLSLIARDSGAAGLSAPQIGEPVAVLAVKLAGRTLTVLANPIVTAHSSQEVEATEECFSLPGVEVRVRRPSWATVSAENMRGVRSARRYVGRDARLVLHELDHLRGILITDRAAPGAREGPADAVSAPLAGGEPPGRPLGGGRR